MCRQESFLKFAMICVFITDVVIATLAIAFVFVFIFGTKYWHFLDYYIRHKTP